ncbi:MAG: flagellar biosynthesis protein FlhF [Bacillota bacterium]
MKVKRYLVRNMSDAVQLIKKEMGPDAVILSSRKIRKKGVFGILRKRIWEVTAAVDEVPKFMEQVSASVEPLSALAKKEVIIRKVPDHAVAESGETDLHKNVEFQLLEIKKMIRKISQAHGIEEDSAPDENRWSELKKILTDMEIKEDLAEKMLNELPFSSIINADNNNEQLYQMLTDKISRLLEPFYSGLLRKKIMVFVGPTGAGKTTTLAKMAARSSLLNKEKVGIITIDSYRIGAVEQLKTYGEIIGVPVEAVLTPDELQTAIRHMENKDMILVDTAGRSFRNREYINELQDFLEILPNAEIFLVLSSNTKEKDLMNNVKCFSKLGFSQLIFTKADETEMLGNIFNVALEAQVPVAYITNGQNVPEDMEKMYPQKLVQLVFKGVNFSDRSGN